MSEYIHTKQLIELEQLKEVMEDIGFQVEILECSSDMPLHLLVAEAKSTEDSKEFIQNISCCFLPIDLSELESLQLLQFYSGLPFVVSDDKKESINELISTINTKTPIGYFGITSGDQVFQRYVYVKNQFLQMDKIQILEVVSLFLHCQNTFANFLFEFSSGKSTLGSVLEQVYKL